VWDVHLDGNPIEDGMGAYPTGQKSLTRYSVAKHSAQLYGNAAPAVVNSADRSNYVVLADRAVSRKLADISCRNGFASKSELRQYVDCDAMITRRSQGRPSEIDSPLRTGCSPIGHFALPARKSSERYFSMYGRNISATRCLGRTNADEGVVRPTSP
jgi:hypothetical protein